jgi:DNA polymerase-3 subunit alpha
MNRLENMTDRFVDAVGEENFFLELQFNGLPAQHLTNAALIQLSNKTGIPLVATADSHYPTPDLWQARELYRRLGWKRKDDEGLPQKEDLKCELYPKNAQQMWDEYLTHKDKYDFYEGTEELVRDCIERTHDIAWEMCTDTWIDTDAKLPDFSRPEKSAFDQLLDLVKEGLRKEGLDKDSEYVARAKYELSDIKHLGFENYFLVMYQVFNLAAEKTLFGCGRGSGAGSLVNYLLGVTQVDPLKYGLLWERFLGRHRTSWPDIDSDVGDRDVLINAARELYGEDAVIPVSNFNTLKLKSLLKDISSFYDVPTREVFDLTKGLQEEVMPQAKDENTEKSVFVLKHDDCMQYSRRYREFMSKYPDVQTHIEALFMQNKSLGRHAGGVIIAPPEQLEQAMPIISVRGELQTPWTEGMNFRNLEDNGFIKFDFLGLTLMEDVRNCIRRILNKQGNPDPSFLEVKEFFDKHLNCRFNEPNDLKVWETAYHQKDFAPGLFQFTAQGARDFCRHVKPTDITELGAITAIYRPGPLKANVHRKYIQTKRKVLEGETITYEHPVIEEILSPTLGYISFQEQFMLLAQKLAGFSPAESDKLRKTLVKKSLDTIGKKGDERAEAREKFVSGARDLHGIPESVSEDLWKKIEFFSVYGFNKSHAVAYAIDSYFGAWLYTYYPEEWIATILQSENDNPKGLSKTINELKRLDYKIAPIDINHSGLEWSYSEEVQAFVPPLSSIKRVGETAAREIIETRPFRNLNEVLFNDDGKWYHSKMNKGCFDSLCKVEAFNSLEEFKDGTLENHRQLLDLLLDNWNVLRKGKKGMSDAAVRRLVKKGERAEDILPELIERVKYTEDWSRTEKIEFNEDLRSAVSNDLFFRDGLLEKLEAKEVPPVTEVPGGKTMIAWFLVRDVQEKKTKKGKTYWRIRAQDGDNNLTWLKVWGKLKTDIPKYSIWLCEAKGDDEWGPSTTGWKIRPLEIE